MWDRVGATIRAGQARAAATAIDVSFSWDDFLLRRVFPDKTTRNVLKNYLDSTANRNVEAAIVRMTRTRMPLSQRVYATKALTEGMIDRRINSALARGINYAQLRKEIQDFVRPSTPGGATYAAKRLARTEINAAYHAISVEQNLEKPWNTGMTWKTSRSHPEPDICNVLADRSPYAPGEVPGKPHPQCLCYVVPETVTPEEFINEFRRGAYDAYLSRTYNLGESGPGSVRTA